jgi:NAD-dependent DNA ligase
MPLRAFEALNEKQEEEGGKAFCESAQCRGGRRACARSGNHAIAAARFLCLLSARRRPRMPMRLHSEALESLQKLRFKVSPDWRVCHSIDAVKIYRLLGRQAREAAV